LNDQHNSKVKIGAIIVAVIAVILYAIFMVIGVREGGGFLALAIVIFAIVSLSPILAAIKSKSLDLIFMIFLPFIGLGVTVYEFGAKKEADVDRKRYIDIQIEQKILRWIAAVKKHESAMKRTYKEYWQNLTPYQFEKEVAKLYSDFGYETRVTSAVADGGIDVIMTKDSQRIAVQCKHHAKPVGPNDVRALQGVVASQGYDYGVFVSLNGFTTSVHGEIARGRVKIELVSLSDILEMNGAMQRAERIAENKNRILIAKKEANTITELGKKEFEYERDNVAKQINNLRAQLNTDSIEGVVATAEKLNEAIEKEKKIDRILTNTVVKLQSNKQVVSVGSAVKTVDEDGEEVVFYIVNAFEANVLLDKISIDSPLGKALCGKRAGDIVRVNTPSGESKYEIIAIL